MRATEEKPLLGLMRRIANKGGQILGVGMMLLLIAIVFWGVIVRYLPVSQMLNLWTQEGGRIVLIWLSFVLAGFISLKDEHFKVTVILDHMPPLAQLIMRTISDLVVAIFGILLMIKGFSFAQQTIGLQTISLEWPAVIMVIPFLLGSVLVFAFTTGRLVWRVIHGFRE